MIQRFIIVFCFLFASLSTQAQLRDVRLALLGGIGFEDISLTADKNLHLSVNPFVPIVDMFSLEGQVGFSQTSLGSVFRRSEPAFGRYLNAMVGPRVYFAGQRSVISPYFNFLIGGVHIREQNQNQEMETTWKFEYSLGFYYEFPKMLLGVTYDAQPMQNLFTVKVGYIVL